MFVTTKNTWLSRHNLYRTFMACCKKATIETQTHGPNQELLEHVDLHSLRMTFATEAIASGADPKSVQELLGHKTLDMTMRIYGRMRAATKRKAVAGLRYGRGSQPPEHVIELADSQPLRVQSGEKIPPATEGKAVDRRNSLRHNNWGRSSIG